MRRFPSRKDRPSSVDIAIFDDAAHREGMRLDTAQRTAALLLATSTENVYLVGPAGRGKTWLLNTFIAARPPGRTARIHWHEFLRDLHDRIRIHRTVDAALTALLGSVDTVCFDELHVDDPADGIYVDHLLDHIATARLRLIVTSNVGPAQLMPNPLFHDAFRPTIGIIEKLCRVVELDTGIDYRARGEHHTGFASGRWVIRTVTREASTVLSVHGRQLRAWDASSRHLGVDFGEICGRPLGATDYLDLAQQFRTWTISSVPDLAASARDPALRFLHLIDVLYDAAVPTTIETSTPRAEFGRGGAVPPGTPRLLSRLSTLRTPSSPSASALCRRSVPAGGTYLRHRAPPDPTNPRSPHDPRGDSF